LLQFNTAEVAVTCVTRRPEDVRSCTGSAQEGGEQATRKAATDATTAATIAHRRKRRIKSAAPTRARWRRRRAGTRGRRSAPSFSRPIGADRPRVRPRSRSRSMWPAHPLTRRDPLTVLSPRPAPGHRSAGQLRDRAHTPSASRTWELYESRSIDTRAPSALVAS